ncbi:MAG: HlyD family secretion protein [Synechococcus sp.]
MTQLQPKPDLDRQPISTGGLPHKPRRRLKVASAIAVAIAATGIVTWQFLDQPESGVLPVSGRIEGYETDVSAKVGGRIGFVAVREGDAVKQGELLVRLDDEEAQAQLRGSMARLTAAKQQERRSQLNLAVIESQIEEVQLIVRQSQGDAEGRILQAEGQLAAAEAELVEANAQVEAAQADLKLAKADRERLAQLLKEGAIPQQQFDQVQARLETEKAALQAREAIVIAARQQVDAARGALGQARTSALNPDIRTAQLAALQTQLLRAEAEVEAARADVVNARAAREEIEARLDFLHVVSPIDGVTLARMVEPAEVVGVGTALLSLVNLDTVYMRGYIPEGDIGRVRVGQAARVFLDSAPDRPLSARVIAIDPEASFTPENIYFRDDRVNQVFGLRIGIDNPEGFAKPGMPADAEILIGESEP